MTLIKRNERPKIAEIAQKLPFSMPYPYGFDKHVKVACQKQLGWPYVGYSIKMKSYYCNKKAKWYAKNMTLYARSEEDLSIITMVLLVNAVNK